MGRDFCNETELRAVVSLFQLKKDLDIKQLYTYLCPVIIFVCFFSIIFNAILMSISRQSKAVNKSPILLLSLNLALTDLIASLFNGLGILFNSYLPEVFDRKMPPCAMLTFEVIRCAALIASALHLLALAFVHYRGIVNPLHYRSTIFFSQHLSRSVNVISVCCWIIPLTIMVVWFSSTPCQGFQTAQCDYLFLTQFNFRYMMLTVFSVPLLLMSAIYIRIFLIINRHQKGRRLQHEQSALVCGVVNATAGVSGTAASVNLSELMMAGRVGGPATTGGTGSDGHDGSKTTNGRWQADKQEQAADRCPVCSGHKAPADYYTSENEDDDDGQEEEDDDDDEDEDDNDDLDEAADGDEDSGNNDQEDEENCDRRRQHRRARRNQSGISALCESERAADAAGARAGERALLICTATEAEAAVAAAAHDERTRANKSKTQDGDDVTRMATDGDPSSVGLITLEHIPLADDRSSVAAAATLRTKGVSGQQSRRRSSDVSREAAAGGRGGDSLRDESAGGGGVSLAGRECDMNLNNKQGQSLDGDAGHRRRAARRLRRERRKLHLVCSASLSSSSRGAAGQSSQSSSDQNNNPEENPAPLGPLGRGGGGAKRCTCDNKLKPAAAPSQRTVKLARANTIGFTAAASETDEPVASMGAASLRILRQANGRQPALTKTATVVTVAAGDAGSSISTCTAADSRAARSRPTPLRLQLRRSPTSPPEAAAAAAASDAGSAHSSVRASSYALKRARSTKVDAAAAALDATSVSATTMTSGIPAANRSFGWPGSAKNNFGAWVTSERTASANSSVHNQRHHEPQRRHVHASAVPQTNTKALVTTLLILGTYVVSYVPAIAWHALTCIDSVVCPFPLYGIPYGWRVLFGSMTTLLLIAKSIVDPLIYSYRMNEIQVALSRYLSKRRSKSSSHATSLHTSQRFTFNAGGGMGENTTYQTNAGGNNPPSTANSSFKILTNSHSSLRYKNKHNNNFAISTRPSPLAATPTLAKPDEDDETVGACESQPLAAVTNRNVSAKLANNVIALDHEQKPPAQMIELVRVDQTNDLTCAQQLTRQEQGAAPIVARTQVKSLKFDEELTGTRSGSSIKDSIPKTTTTTTEPNSIVVNLQQPKQRLDTHHSGHKLENNATASANGARGDLVC